MLSKSLPFLPGHVFSDPMNTQHKKEQIFTYTSKTCIEKPRYLEPIDEFTLKSLKGLTQSAEIVPKVEEPVPRSSSLNEAFPRVLPQWMKYDKRVLRFEGYFNEHVNESAHENYRIRRCTLNYYLDDDTLQVIENRVPNSGIVQGEFIKRHRALNQDSKSGEFINWKDFRLGGEIYMYGKKFRICTCDKFTKDFYKEKNIDLGTEEVIPEIDFGDKFKNVDFDKMKKLIMESKEYTEVKNGGAHSNKGLKQFLENDRKVLCFDITWFDNLYDKEQKNYKMNYYLSDGQIEVCEIRYNNSGKDPFPRLLRKCKLPKKAHMGFCPGLELPEDEYYLPEDLILGNYVNVYGRQCHIISCDEFTKNWYKQK